MTSEKKGGLIQQFLLGLPLRKTLLASTGIAILLLLVVSILGIRQYILYQHCEQVVTTSKHLLFQFSSIKEHINEALITKEKLHFKDIQGEIEDLDSIIDLIQDDILIPEEFKQGFMNQTDLIGLVVKLRSVQETNDTPSSEQLSAVTTLLRSMYGSIAQFHQGLSSYTQALLLGLHKTFAGCLALVISVISTLLFLINRSISGPLLQLGQQLQGITEGGKKAHKEQNTNLDLSVHEIVNSVTILSAEHQRLSRIFSAITLYETLDQKATSPTERWHDICSALQANADYCLVWVGDLLQDEELPHPVSACGCLGATEEGCLDILDHLLKYCKKDGGLCDSVSKAMQTRRTTVSRLFTSSLPESLRGLLPFTDDTFSSASFPIPSRDKTVAIITLYNPGHDCFQTCETRLLAYFFNHLVNNQREAAPSTLSSTPADTVSIQTLSRIYRYYALGSLTTGLAHELTDLSNGAINYTQALLDLTDDQPQTMEPKALLDKLLAEEKKISRLAVDLQQFNRDTGEESRQYSVQELLQPIDTLTKGQARAEGIELQVSIDPGLPLIPKNGPDIQLVILSLVQNARNRISAKYPGGRDKKKKIQIRATLAQQKAYNQVLITIQDQGTSWPSLEPAQNDSGSAPEPWLELHQCRLFLQNFGGDLVIESDSDQKNICSLFLPC